MVRARAATSIACPGPGPASVPLRTLRIGIVATRVEFSRRCASCVRALALLQLQLDPLLVDAVDLPQVLDHLVHAVPLTAAAGI